MRHLAGVLVIVLVGCGAPEKGEAAASDMSQDAASEPDAQVVDMGADSPDTSDLPQSVDVSPDASRDSDANDANDTGPALECNGLLSTDTGQLPRVFLDDEPFAELVVAAPDGMPVEWSFRNWEDADIPTVNEQDSRRVAVPAFDRVGGYGVHFKAGDCTGSHVFYRTQPDMLMIALEWDTVDDLDLHFLHPFGVWNNRPYDVFAGNHEAAQGQWAALMRRDDSDGEGPEVITMTEVEAVTYQVGVHHSGNGVSRATVRVIRGVAEYAVEARSLDVGEFWLVGDVTYPGPAWTLQDEVTDGFPD